MALFNILVDIAAKTAGFEEGMRRVEDRLTGFEQSVEKAGKKVAGFAAGYIGIEALRESIERAIKRGDEFQRLSERTKQTTEDLSRLEYVAIKNDMAFELLVGSMDTFTKNVGMASDGTGKAQKALAALHIDAEKLVKLPLAQQLSVIADAIASIENPAKQAQYTMQLFGDANMLSILRGGAAGIKALSEESDNLGNTLSTKTALALSQADDQIKQLTVSWRALQTQLALGTAIIGKGVGLIPKTEMDKAEEQYKDLLKKREGLVSSSKIFEKGPYAFIFKEDAKQELKRYYDSIAEVDKEIYSVIDHLAELQAKSKEELKPLSIDLGYDIKSPSLPDPTNNAIQDLDKLSSEIEQNMAAYEERRNQIVENEFAYRRDLHEKELHLYDEQIMDSIKQQEDLNAKMFEGMAKQTERTLDRQYKRMTEFAKSAAQNIQSVFADFLYDPFKDGIEGMLKGFADVLRRMVAEAASAQILDSIFKSNSSKSGNGLSDFLGGLFGGMFKKGGGSSSGSGSSYSGPDYEEYGGEMAKGGPLEQGKWYTAGEHGPEPIWGGGPGAFAMGYGQSAPIVVHNNIDARGATMELARALPGLLDQATARAVAQARDDRRRNR